LDTAGDDLVEDRPADEAGGDTDRQDHQHAADQGAEVGALGAGDDPAVDRVEGHGQDGGPKQHADEGLEHQPAQVERAGEGAQEDDPAGLVALVAVGGVHGALGVEERSWWGGRFF
jgi:hypothetical protein